MDDSAEHGLALGGYVLRTSVASLRSCGVGAPLLLVRKRCLDLQSRAVGPLVRALVLVLLIAVAVWVMDLVSARIRERIV